MARSIVLLVAISILMLLPISLPSFAQTPSREFRDRVATNIEVTDYMINNTVVFRMFRLNKVLFVILNRDLMLDLGDKVYTFNVKKYGISGRDINIAHDKVREYFELVEKAESERIKKDLEPILSIKPYQEFVKRYREFAEKHYRGFIELSNKTIEILRSVGIEEVHLLTQNPLDYIDSLQGVTLIDVPTYNIIIFSTTSKKNFDTRNYVSVIRGLAALANNYQNLLLVEERFAVRFKLLCLSDLHNVSRECEEAYNKLREIPCYLHVGVSNFWGPFISFNKTCIEELAAAQGRSVDGVTSEIIEKTKMAVHEIRKIDPALTRVVIWIEHATPPPILLPSEAFEILNITRKEIRNVGVSPIPRIDVIKRNITVDELDKIFEEDQSGDAAVAQSMGVNFREAVNKVLVYIIIAIPIAVVVIFIFKKRWH